jgi:hypothetical protein
MLRILSLAQSNLAKTPGGAQVFGARARNSLTALAALLATRDTVDVSAREVDRSFDFIFIDGGHGAPAVLADAVLSFNLLRPGGVIAFDDYGGGSLETKAGIDAFLAAFSTQLRVVHSSYILIATKNNWVLGRFVLFLRGVVFYRDSFTRAPMAAQRMLGISSRVSRMPLWLVLHHHIRGLCPSRYMQVEEKLPESY